MTDAATAAHADRRRVRARRLLALVILAGVICGGLVVHAALADSAVTDIAGDALYAIAAYVGVVLLAPRARSITIGALALGWCVAIECFQLTGIPIALGDVFAPAMLVLGTVFDARDLLVYAIAVIATSAVDALARSRSRSARLHLTSSTSTTSPTSTTSTTGTTGTT